MHYEKSLRETMTKVLCFLLVVLTQSACTNIKQSPFNKSSSSFPVEVETLEVKQENKKNILTATGSLESPKTTELTSETSGKIIYLNIPEGKLINKGQLLAKINDSTIIAEKKISEGKLKNAKDNFERMKALREKGAISQQTLDNTLEVLNTAEGEYERSISSRQMTDVVAPFSGVLSIKKVSEGAFIEPGDVIVRISQIDPLHLIFSLPEKYTSKIKEGQNIKFKVTETEKEYTAKVIVIDPYINPDTRSVQIKGIVSNPNKELLPGKFANVKLETNDLGNIISIPQEALIQEGNKKQVAIVTKDNIVAFKEVTVTNWEKDSVIISEGLNEGDIVVTSGHQKLKPDMKVIRKPYQPIYNQQLVKETN
jgi:membrane fusion protein (multidrug efflux system)